MVHSFLPFRTRSERQKTELYPGPKYTRIYERTIKQVNDVPSDPTNVKKWMESCQNSQLSCFKPPHSKEVPSND